MILTQDGGRVFCGIFVEVDECPDRSHPSGPHRHVEFNEEFERSLFTK
jgi:hypothetical protein